MKKLASGIIGLAALVAAPAMAADLAVKAPFVPPPVFSWTGCYIGVHVGAGWQTSDYTTNVADNGGVGGVGGAQAGCNLQWRQFVIGLEGEFWGSTLRDRNFFSDQFETFDALSRNRWDATLAARAGVAFDRAFIYGKVGLAVGKFDYSTDQAFVPNQTFTERGSAVFAGVVMGVGFEYAFTDNWTAKFEYDYIDFGNKVVNFTDVRCNGGVCATTFPNFTVKERKQIAKIGVNYKFGYGDSVVAKY
jgi:outer membrane immunogenic protein